MSEERLTAAVVGGELNSSLCVKSAENEITRRVKGHAARQSIIYSACRTPIRIARDDALDPMNMFQEAVYSELFREAQGRSPELSMWGMKAMKKFHWLVLSLWTDRTHDKNPAARKGAGSKILRSGRRS